MHRSGSLITLAAASLGLAVTVPAVMVPAARAAAPGADGALVGVGARGAVGGDRTARWSTARVLGPSGARAAHGDDPGTLDASDPRVAVSPDGSGVVVFNTSDAAEIDDASVRRFGPGGALGPRITLARNGVEAVSVDAAGEALLSGFDGTHGRNWIARSAPGSDTWPQVVVPPNVVAAFGIDGGFSVITQLEDGGALGVAPISGDPTSPPALGSTVFLDPSIDVDGSAGGGRGVGAEWAQLASGAVVGVGVRTVSPAGGRAKATAVPTVLVFDPPSVGGAPAVATAPSPELSGTPAAGATPPPQTIDLTGDPGFGHAVVDASGDTIAIAGLHVEKGGLFGGRGVPAYALGSASSVGALHEIPGVSARLAVDPGVAAGADGGAVVTWVQRRNDRSFPLVGVPHWAVVGADGTITARGIFSTDTHASSLEIKRVGSAFVAVWADGTQRRSALHSAVLRGSTVTALAGPSGQPVGPADDDTTIDLAAAGNVAAVVYSDERTETVRLSRIAVS